MGNSNFKIFQTDRITVWALILLSSIGALGSQFSCKNNSETKTVQSSEITTNPQRLTGRWLRPDGGYVLEIQKVHSDGQVEAAYLNPRPINVAEAKVEEKQGKLNLLVILRDEGYPGSYYDLLYDPSHDQLIGDYYQATIGQVFTVQFVRLPE